LDDYLAELEKFENNIDRAVKALLFSITSGMAKRIVSNATSAHKALLDLKEITDRLRNLTYIVNE
jgi:hypothetical protein